jgi:xylan 1,4-beta-xylosidase
MNMDRPAYTFEYVEHIKNIPIKCFIAAVDHSCHHWHTDIEILFVLDGTLNLTMNNQSYWLKAGEIVLINSKTVHAIDFSDGNNLVFVLQFLPSIYESEYRKTSFHFNLNTAAAEIQTPENISELQYILACIGVEIYLNNDGFQFYIKSLLYQLVGYLFRYTRYDILDKTRCTLQDSDLARLEMIVKYINENYQHGFSFAEVAERLNLSLSQCSRFFKEKMGISFSEYLRHVQITHAKRLILETGHTVLFVSEDSGFTSLASFYRAFKGDTGMTPTEYRERGETAGKIVDTQVAGYTSVNPSIGYELLKQYLIHDQEKR